MLRLGGGADKWIKVLIKINESCTVFIAPSMFIKTLLSLYERTGSLCDTAAAVSFFQPPKLCYLQSNDTKADSKKDKVRDGNPFFIHYAQPVDRGGA